LLEKGETDTSQPLDVVLDETANFDEILTYTPREKSDSSVDMEVIGRKRASVDVKQSFIILNICCI
jgi:hypothetical protein